MTRGVAGQEREELLSEPPEYQSSEKLDTIGIEHDRGTSSGGRTKSGRRISSRRMDAEPSSASQRQKQEWAQARLRKLKPLIWVAVGAAVLGIACYIPITIRNKFIDKLGSAKANERESAAVNLGEKKSGLNRAADLIRGCQKPEDFEKAGGAAAMALAVAGDDGAALLTTLAEDKNPVARLCAVYGLGLSGRTSAVAPLVKRLSDDDLTVKIQATKALGGIRTPDALKALIAQAQGSSDIQKAAVAAVYAIACVENLNQIPALSEVRTELVNGLKAQSSEMRHACGRALIMLNQVPGDADLLQLINSPEPSVKAGAIEFLGLIGGPIFDQKIPESLDDKSAEVRAAAAAAAGLRRSTRDLEKLEKLLQADDQPLAVRMAAIQAIGTIGKLESTGALARTLVNTKAPDEARIAAAEALVAISKQNPYELKREPDHKDHLAHIKVSSQNPDPRWAALEILASGCDGFGEKVAKSGFEAMAALSGRKYAAQAATWKTWMTRMLNESKLLGEASYCFEQATIFNKAKNLKDAGDMAKKAFRIIEKLKNESDPEDKDFYKALFENIEPQVRPLLKEEPAAPKETISVPNL